MKIYTHLVKQEFEHLYESLRNSRAVSTVVIVAEKNCLGIQI